MEHLHSILVNTAGFFSDMTIVVSVCIGDKPAGESAKI